jgi:cell division initiation protein
MIAPHELKNKTFTRVVRGYNPVEVDQYFDFLIEKYTEAYKAACELEQKYNKIEAKYAELSGEEESIRSAILKAQKLGEAIVNNAKKDAKKKESELRGRCDEIIAEAKEKVQEEKENIARLRKTAIDFQHQLYSEYVKHVEMIKNMKLEESVDAEMSDAEEQNLLDAKNLVLGDSEGDIISSKESISETEDPSKNEQLD